MITISQQNLNQINTFYQAYELNSRFKKISLFATSVIILDAMHFTVLFSMKTSILWLITFDFGRKRILFCRLIQHQNQWKLKNTPYLLMMLMMLTTAINTPERF